MAKKTQTITRRDRCWLLGRRGLRLTPDQAALAWQAMCAQLCELQERDIPKFKDLIQAVRNATVLSHQIPVDTPPET